LNPCLFFQCPVLPCPFVRFSMRCKTFASKRSLASAYFVFFGTAAFPFISVSRWCIVALSSLVVIDLLYHELEHFQHPVRGRFLPGFVPPVRAKLFAWEHELLQRACPLFQPKSDRNVVFALAVELVQATVER